MPDFTITVIKKRPSNRGDNEKSGETNMNRQNYMEEEPEGSLQPKMSKFMKNNEIFSLAFLLSFQLYPDPWGICFLFPACNQFSLCP